MKINWDYIAGFFDGEGCVSIQRSSKRDYGNASHMISISQSGLTGLRVLSDIVEFLKQHGIVAGFRLDQRAGSHHRKKDSYLIRIVRRESTIKFLEAMLPRVSVKKVVVQDHLRYLKLYKSLQKISSYASESQARRSDSTIERRKKVCVICNTPFMDKSSAICVKTCSRFCADTLLWRTRRAAKQANTKQLN